MKKRKIISVIVPIFNVSKYIDRCIESIRNQSYSDLEIILVDDGSTDSSGSICDNYAAVDKRIKVVHKENGGLVTARKAGLESATGEYIAFVDGDDWIDAAMYSHMIELCEKNDADFVESGYTYHRGKAEVKFPCKEGVICLNDSEREILIREWMSQPGKATVRNVIWSKIYRAAIIKHAYSKVDNKKSLGEDLISYLHLIKNSTKVVVTSKINYHYVFRENSLAHDYAIERLRNSCGLFCECCELIREMYPVIDENTVNAWFAQRTVEDFYKLNFDREVPMPIYKIKNIDDLRNKKIVIYGAGNVGKDIYIQLCKYDNIQIVDWIDKNNERYHYPYYKVHNASILPNLKYDVILIAVLREQVANFIKNDILDYGCPEEKIIWIEIGKVIDYFIPEPVGYNIVRCMGGLGNQMFQYAFYRALEEAGQNVTFNIDFFISGRREFELQDVFPNVKIKYDNIHAYDSYKNSLSFHGLYQEAEVGVYDARVLDIADCSLNGYWQSERYFEKIKTIIRKEFVFAPKETALIRLAEQIRKKENSVSLHVRHGDYFEFPEIYGGICTIDYYDKAIRYINEKVAFPQFFVFSDDLDWVRNNLVIENAIYINSMMFETYNDWYDMYLMSECKHNIIANSTFSWWGAWLNSNKNKIVIAPKKWVNVDSMEDICPEDWIRI